MTEINTQLSQKELEAQKKAEEIKASQKINPKKLTATQKEAVKNCKEGQEHATAISPLTGKLKGALTHEPSIENSEQRLEEPLDKKTFENIFSQASIPKKGNVTIPQDLKTQIQAEVLNRVENKPVEITDPKDKNKTRTETAQERDIRVKNETTALIQKLAIEKKAELLKKRSAKTGEVIKNDAKNKDGKPIQTIAQRLEEIRKKYPEVGSNILRETVSGNFQGFNQDKDGKELPFNAEKYFKGAENIAKKLSALKKGIKTKINHDNIAVDSQGNPDLSDPTTAKTAAQAAGVPQDKVADILAGKLTGMAVLAKILLWFLEPGPPKFDKDGFTKDPKTGKKISRKEYEKKYGKYETKDNYKYGKNDETGNSAPFRGKDPEKASKFKLNDKFYNKEKLRNDIVNKYGVAKAKETDDIANKFKEPWQGAVYRNALKRGDNFSKNQPLLLHNVGTHTAALFLPGGKVQYSRATHGRGVGNVPNQKATPLGSFNTYYMSNGKYTGRLGVRGVEPSKQNYKASPGRAFSIDPSSVGNTRADRRLIRVHNIRSRGTAGCTGLPTGILKQYQNAARNGGGMEVFTSNAI